MPRKLLAERRQWSNNIDILYIEDTGRGDKISVVSSIVMEEVDANSCIYSPTFTLRQTEAQELMDSLWQCGLRPSEGTGSAGSLAATERHLKDMQSILLGSLKRLGIEVPK